MKLNFKITTQGLTYSTEHFGSQIIKKILVLLFLLILLYLCMIGYIELTLILKLLYIYWLVIFYRILNYLIIQLVVSKIESMLDITSKRKFLLSLNKLYHRLNIFCYFINSNFETFVIFRR